MASPSEKVPGVSDARVAELLELAGPELPARFPVRALRVFRTAFADPALTQVLSAALNRRRSGEFDPGQSQQLYRLARVWLAALEAFQEPARARRFLTSPHALLGGIKPLECAVTGDADLLRVESVLGRLQYGSAA